MFPCVKLKIKSKVITSVSKSWCTDMQRLEQEQSGQDLSALYFWVTIVAVFFTVPMPDPLELMAKSWLRILVQSGHGKEWLLLEMRVSNRGKLD